MASPKEEKSNSGDRSSWASRFERSHGDIKQLKERLYPIERATSFGQEYLTTLDSRKRGKKEDVLSERVLMQLILQHLEMEGLKTSRKLLEQESKQKYVQHPDLNESRLVTILRMVVKDTERVWDLTIDDKFTTSKHNFQELQDHLMDLDLLVEEPNEGVEDISVWEENLFNIIMDEKDNRLTKAASLNHLILKLTENNEEDYDPQLVAVFLTTYKTFTTPEKFLQKMVERYQVPAKDPTGVKRDDEWKATKRRVQIRVINVVRKWITDHYDDFRNSDKLMKALEEFVTIVETDNKALARPLTSALSLRERENDRTITRDWGRGKPAPEPRVSLRTIFSPSLDLLECDEEEIARQLTIAEFEIYASIKSSELLNLAWSKPKLKHRAPNVLKVSERSTKLSQWVATNILKEERIRKRIKVMHKFIRIAEHLINMNNFSTAMSIIAGLNMNPVHRLKYTFAEIPNQSLRTFNELEQKLSSTSAYRTYRAILSSANPPCIPYLGTYLTDLTFIDGNSDTYRGLINVYKRRLMYDVIEKIERYQNMGYNFIPIPQIQTLLETKRLHIASEEECLRMSLAIEPRNADRSEIL